MTDHTQPTADDCPGCQGGDKWPNDQEVWRCPVCDAEYQDSEARIMAAIETATDPRDAVIAQLVDALCAIEMWDAARGYPIPYRHRDPMRAALAAAKAVM